MSLIKLYTFIVPQFCHCKKGHDNSINLSRLLWELRKRCKTFGKVLFFKYLFIWLHWVLVGSMRGLRCGMRDVSCGTWGLSCGMRAPSCSMWGLVPEPGIEPGPPVVGAGSLNHWITREVPRKVLGHIAFNNCTSYHYYYCYYLQKQYSNCIFLRMCSFVLLCVQATLYSWF